MMGLTGCSSLSTSVQSSNIRVGNHADFQADLNIGEKISGTCSATRIFGLLFGDVSTFGGGNEAVGVYFDDISASKQASDSILGQLISGASGTIPSCARAAAYNAVVKNGADVIFAPRYTAEVSGIPGLFTTYNVNLTGYKATIKGFKQLDTQKMMEGHK